MNHLHAGIPELLVFALMLLVVGGSLRLLSGYLATLDNATAQRIAGALGVIY